MTIEVSKKEKQFVDDLRQLSNNGRDYVMQKIRVVKDWEKFVAAGEARKIESGARQATST